MQYYFPPLSFYSPKAVLKGKWKCENIEYTRCTEKHIFLFNCMKGWNLIQLYDCNLQGCWRNMERSTAWSPKLWKDFNLCGCVCKRESSNLPERDEFGDSVHTELGSAGGSRWFEVVRAALGQTPCCSTGRDEEGNWRKRNVFFCTTQ